MMYNLFIRWDPSNSAWSKDTTYSIDQDRVFEYCDKGPAISEYKDNLERRKELPCLFAYELFDGAGQVGYIRSIRMGAETVRVDYQLDDSFPPIPILDADTYRSFGCEDYEWYRTHWAVKNVDLFRVIAKDLLQKRELPHFANSSDLNKLWGDDSGSLFRIFISHREEDRRRASDIANGLRELGHSAFVAHEDIPPTTEWRSQLLFALSTMTHFVGLVSDGFHESSWTEQETGYAYARKDVKRIFVKLSKTDPMGLASSEQAITSNWENAVRHISKEIGSAPETRRGKPAGAESEIPF